MAASVPERCPQCHSPVAERFPHAVMYDCGFSFFNDGEPVTDDYPAECQRRRIKRLEKQLTAARAETERWQAELVAAREVIEAARPIVNAEHDVDPVDVYYLREAIRRYDERCGGGDQ